MPWCGGPIYLNILELYRYTVYANSYSLNRLGYYLNR